jgi:predicted ATPase/DNA-binding SARP family transcriptional activator
MLEVRLIGRFDIKDDGNSVLISSRSAQSLFAYLVLNAGTSYRREKLAGMFWPNASEQKARSYLRHELWRIRKALSSASTYEYLLADDIHITFNSSAAYWFDVAMLNKLAEGASIEESMEALAVYQGELLPGFYEDWVLVEREHLQSVYEKRIARLLELLQHEKRWRETLDWAERWISCAQTPEAAYRALMLAYDALGDPAKVAATYERCVEALATLGLEPSEETRSLASRRSSKTNVPIPLTSFIGRENELNEVASLLTRSRLVTLTGSGGVGKTRLAIQVVADLSERFPDGIWFFDLAPLTEPALVPDTLANMLGLHEAGEVGITDLLINYFYTRTALVIFDNCEHLIEACAHFVHSLLTSGRSLKILATSREPLRISGEITYRVPSLEVPKVSLESGVQTVEEAESVRLFRERAAAASPGLLVSQENAFTIAQICQRLDGIPLAIELAAARTNVLTVEQILTRLEDRFNLLTSGTRTALPRQQTLWATIEWSYSLLTEKERILFRRLAVFTGGWILEAAEKICSRDGIQPEQILDLLSQLIHKSLVAIELRDGESRYRRLEIIRAFAREKLIEATEAGRLQDRHLEYFLKLAEQADREIHGPNQVMCMDRLENEHDNLRAALAWCVSKRNTEAAVRLLSALSWAWFVRDRASETSSWFNQIRRLPQIETYPELLAKLLTLMGEQCTFMGDFHSAKSLLEESQTIWLTLSNSGKQGLAKAIDGLGSLAALQNDSRTAQAFFEQSFKSYEEHRNEWGMALVTCHLAGIAISQGDLVEAEKRYKRSLAEFQSLGDHFMIGTVLNGLGGLALYSGDYERAGKYYEELLKISRELHGRFIQADAFIGLAWVSLHKGDDRRAKLFLEESLELWEASGDRPGIIGCLIGFAGLLTLIHKTEQAALLLGAVESLTEELGYMLPTHQDNFYPYVGKVCAELDEAVLAHAWAEGRSMTLEQCIQLARAQSAE